MATYQDEFNDAIPEIDPWVRSQREKQAEDKQEPPKKPWERLRRGVKALSQVVWLRWTVLAVISAAIGVAVNEVWNNYR